MANYYVIGGDNKEYGPVTEVEVRQWMAEGRLNADSRIKAESDAEFRVLGLYPEFSPALAPEGTPAAFAPMQSPEDILERDYELDIGGCISRGWEVYKENFGIIFGSFLVAMLVYMAAAGAMGLIRLPFNTALLAAPAWVRTAFEFFNSCLLTLIFGPLMGGLFLVYLKVIRAQTAGLGELFAGFQRAYLPLFLGALALSLITGACTLPVQYAVQARVVPLLQQMQHLQNSPTEIQNLMPQLVSAFTSLLPLVCVCMLPATFFSVTWQFTLALIIDKQLGVGAALKTGWHMVLKHWWYVFGLTVLAGLLGMAGAFGCCIGVIFTIPLGMVAMMIAYETIFNS